VSKTLVAVSGRKQSGKSSLCHFLQAHLWKKLSRHDTGSMTFSQRLTGEIDWTSQWIRSGDTYVSEEPCDLDKVAGIYNFADALKGICIDLLGLTHEQVWGTDEQKNSRTQFMWENLPTSIRWANGGSKLAKPPREDIQKLYDNQIWRLSDEQRWSNCFTLGWQPEQYRSGHMTAREVMQVVGTDVMRKMFYDGVWVDSTLRKVANSAAPIALIADLRFRSEFAAVQKAGGYLIRLERVVHASDNHSSEKDFDGFDFESIPNILIIPEQVDIETKNKLAAEWLENVVLKETHDRLYSIDPEISTKEACRPHRSGCAA
jgi:hypothetical protein